jgi:hypothetical protein
VIYTTEGLLPQALVSRNRAKRTDSTRVLKRGYLAFLPEQELTAMLLEASQRLAEN